LRRVKELTPGMSMGFEDEAIGIAHGQRADGRLVRITFPMAEFRHSLAEYGKSVTRRIATFSLTMSQQKTPHPNHLAHFAIEADDLAWAKRFYSHVFEWRFEAWGPPDFYMIQTKEKEDPGVFGSLQKRHHARGDALTGFECTIAVTDVDKTA